MSDKLIEINQYKFPTHLYYNDRHLWFRKEPDGSITTGLDDLGQKLAGRILMIRLPAEGTSLKPGTVFGTIESAKWIERLRSSVTGIVKSINNKVKGTPSLVNQDPYGEGWLIKITPTADMAQELSELATGDALKSWAVKEIEDKERLKK